MSATNIEPQSKVEQAASQEEQKRKVRESMGNIRQKLIVLSGKGGVGKSTVAANLAVALAGSGHSVGLLDVDIHGPSIPKIMGLQGRSLLAKGSRIIPVKIGERLIVMSIEFLIGGKADAVIWRGPLKYGVIRQFLSDVAWGSLDYLVIDCPPGTGDEPLSVAQLVGRPAAGVIVTTPQELAINDVRRCATFCDKMSLPVLGIIENMSGFICPQCGARANLFGEGGGERLSKEMNIPLLGNIPIDPHIVIYGDTGKPFIESDFGSPSARAFAECVRRIALSESVIRETASQDEPTGKSASAGKSG